MLLFGWSKAFLLSCEGRAEVHWWHFWARKHWCILDCTGRKTHICYLFSDGSSLGRASKSQRTPPRSGLRGPGWQTRIAPGCRRGSRSSSAWCSQSSGPSWRRWEWCRQSFWRRFVFGCCLQSLGTWTRWSSLWCRWRQCLSPIAQCSFDLGNHIDKCRTYPQNKKETTF